MISRFKSLIKNVVGISTTKIECSIDEETVDCKTFTQPYVGVPAPSILKNDAWFGEPIMSEQQKEIADDISVNMDGGVGGSWKVNNEPENIHQVMYEISTKNSNTLNQVMWIRWKHSKRM
jgi:hypothetical protein